MWINNHLARQEKIPLINCYCWFMILQPCLLHVMIEETCNKRNLNCPLSFDICVETQQELNSTRSWIQAQEDGYLFMYTNVLLSCFLVIFTVICLFVVWRNDWHTRSWVFREYLNNHTSSNIFLYIDDIIVHDEEPSQQ